MQQTLVNDTDTHTVNLYQSALAIAVRFTFNIIKQHFTKYVVVHKCMHFDYVT